MAKTKKNYPEMTNDDLTKELDGLLKGLFNLRVRKVTDVVENPAAFRQSRREIARIKTELRARELKKAKAISTPVASTSAQPEAKTS